MNGLMLPPPRFNNCPICQLRPIAMSRCVGGYAYACSNKHSWTVAI